jgi:hypothetical protein
VRSGYADVLAAAVAAGAALAAAVAWAAGRRHAGAGPWAFVAVFAAWLVQGLCGTAPLRVVSDAVFHANKLAQVSAGDWFPTSVTQHARAFRIPYGVSFYALLVPLHRMGLDPALLVRAGAAASGILASAALFLLLAARSPRAAAVAVVVLQLVPATFDYGFSYGNLSNAFGQSMTVLLFAWWAGGGRRGAVGAALLALAALSHLSSLIVLMVLLAALVAARGREVLRDRPRIVAVGAGLALAALYYVHFAPLVFEQVPRLLEGGGQGRGASQGVWAAARLQVLTALGEWGIAAMVLASFGRPRTAAATAAGAPSSGSHLDRDLCAFWVAGLLLAVPAVVSPLEVRYVYALTLPLAAAAGLGWDRLAARGGVSSVAAWLLLAVQAVAGARAVIEAVLFRYRV